MEILSKIDCYEDFKKLHIRDLPKLAQELRDTIINTISNNGGHLASNLGAIELTIALLYSFNLPNDKIIWDVGHQCYAHKILTGRRSLFPTIRKEGGLSGFPKRSESVYDSFDTGHSSTSISAGLGMAVARDIKNEKFKVISVIGDGSLTAGIAFEGLNLAGSIDKDLIIILNDNEMSISKNVGALSSYLSKILTGKIFTRLREDFKKTIQLIPSVGDQILKFMKHTEASVKGFVIPPGVIFEELGYEYVGPIDGHNIDVLLETFENIKSHNKPILIHVYTKKGKGYSPAENQPTKFHGIGSFTIETGDNKHKSNCTTYTEAFSDIITHLAANDSKIVAITAAMPSGTGLEKFSKNFPDRFFDCGISEQHCVTFAAGLATQGFIPVVAIYSTFLQRAYDMLLHDVALQNLHIIFALDRAGIVGEDGPTHHGVFDISYLRHIPNFIIMAPKNQTELKDMITFATKVKSPIAIRYPRGCSDDSIYNPKTPQPIEIGRSEVISNGENLLLISVGHIFENVIKAAEPFQNQIELINLRFIKPLDEELLQEKLLKFKKVIVVEENVTAGGAGSAILEFASRKGILDFKLFKIIGIDNIFVEHGSQKYLRERYGLSTENIKKEIEGALDA